MTGRWKKSKMVVTVLGMAFILGSCGQGSGENTSAPPTGAETARTSEVVNENEKVYKDELNIAVTAQPPTLDTPMTVSNLSIDIGGNIFEQLYTLNENFEFVPELAESVDISEDGLVYTFPLRKGVKFHNEKEMTADDVVASMNRWLATSTRAKNLLAGANFEKVDDYTVKLTVKEATSDVLLVVSSRAQFAAIIPKEIAESAPPEGISEYIGTGPYKFKEWKQDQYIHLVRNEDYQPVDSAPSGYSGRKEAPTANLYYYFVSDHSIRVAGIKTGEYDIAESIPIENYDELAADGNITLYARSSGVLNLFFNTSEGLLSDVKYRQAILAALNNNEIMLAGFADPEHYTLDPGYMSIDQPLWAVQAGAEYYNQANPEKAKKLLQEAGYNGETVTLLTTKDYQEMYAATLVIQEQLRQIGINAEVANFDFPTFLETKNDRSKWDIFVTSNTYGLSPVQLSALNPDWAGFTNEKVPALLAAIRGAATPEDAKKEWEKLQLFMYENASSTPIGHYKSIMAASNKVEGFTYFDQPIYWNAKVEK